MTAPRRLPREAFGDQVASLGTGEFASFVTALLRARGWDVDDEEPLLRLHRTVPRGDRSVLAIADPTESPAVDDVDRIVTARQSIAVERLADGLGADVVGPDGLYDRLLYGIDREVADEICREYLGRGVTAEFNERGGGGRNSTIDSGSEPERVGSEPDRPVTAVDAVADDVDTTGNPERRRGRLLAGVTLLVVLAAAVAAGTGGFAETPLGASGPSVDAGEPDSVTPTAASSTDSGGSAKASTHAGRMVAPTSPAVTNASTHDRRYVELTPTCERPPGLVAVVIVEALRNNDPETDDGIRAAWNFSSRASRGATYETFSRFVTRDRFDPLYDFERATYTEVYREPRISGHRVTVADETGEQHSYVVYLANQTSGPREGCWLLAGIVAEE